MKFNYRKINSEHRYTSDTDVCGLEGLMKLVHFLPENTALVVTKDYSLLETQVD